MESPVGFTGAATPAFKCGEVQNLDSAREDGFGRRSNRAGSGVYFL